LLKWILLAFFSLHAFALEISIDSAKDNFTKYSTLHIWDKNNFICHRIKNDFNEVTEVLCAFSKRPAQEIKHLQNSFFKVDTFTKKDTFFISIKPFYKIKLLPNIFDLTKDDAVFNADVSLSNRWSIIGYKDKFPLIKKEEKSNIAINFPFYLDKDKMPYVGSLDLKGNPVYIKKVEDVTDYLKIKKYFSQKRYDDCLGLINDTLTSYPNTLFKSELVYYKIRCSDKLKDYDSVITHAKNFLREYSSDENVAEILVLMAKAYAKIGQNTDADYFFDRLFSEHKNNVYAQWGFIYKGEMLESSGGNKEAVKYYKKALFETKDLEVGASAAYHLSNLLLLNSNKKDASKYAMKIINAKPAYFMEDLKTSFNMMDLFANKNEYSTAAAIANAILHEMGPTYDEYEGLLKDKGLWLSKTNNKTEALKALNAYLKQFPDGDYSEDVQTAKDGLFFDRADLNVSEKFIQYDKLIEEYAGDEIAQRALYEKVKLLLDEKKYMEVLMLKKQLQDLESSFKDIDSMIKEAAMGSMRQSLENKKCDNVLVISNEYNITLSDKWDDGIYNCAMLGGDFQLAKQSSSKYLKSNNINTREKWLYRYLKIDFATGNYSEVVDAAKDLIALISNMRTSKYKDVYRYLFDAYKRLEQKNNMIAMIAKIEDTFGVSYEDIDRYVAVVGLGSELHDDNMVIKYAKQVVSMQKKSESHAQSPYIEFTLYQAYMNKHDFNNALEIIKSLDSVKISKNDRAREKYLLGSVLNKLWRDSEATQAYKDAIATAPNSAWAKLAKSALEA